MKMTWRLVGVGAVLVVVGAGVPVYAALTGSTTPVNAAAEAPANCPRFTMAIVRGSDESTADGSEKGSVVVTLGQQTLSRVPTGLLIVTDVDYPAVSPVTAVKGLGVDSYGNSVAAGKTGLKNELYLQRHRCPDSRFLLAGFSQGAQVARESVQDFSSGSASDADRALWDHVAAVILIADPKHIPGEPNGFAGFNTTGSGMLNTLLTRPSVAFTPATGARVRSICHTDDPVCHFTAVNLALCTLHNFKPPCGHLMYDRDLPVVADYLTTIITGTTSSPPQAPPVPTTSPSTLSAAPIAPAPPPTPPQSPAQPPAPVPTTIASPRTVAAAPPQAPLTRRPNPPTQLPSQPPMDPGGQAPPVRDPGQQPVPTGYRSLGGVDLQRYCHAGWGLNAQQRFPNAYGWVCSPSPVPASGPRVGDQPISVLDACREQYSPEAVSHYADYDVASSWGCWGA